MYLKFFLKKLDRPFPRHRWEINKKLLERMARSEVVEKALCRDSRSCKDQPLTRRAKPIQH